MKVKQKRLFSTLLFLPLAAARLAAFEPPLGGDVLPLLGHPGLVAGAASSAGSLFFDPFRAGGSSTAPYAAAINPALVANNQRVSLDAGYTGLFQTKSGEAASAAHYGRLGGLVPTRWGVAALGFQFNIGQVPAFDIGQTAALSAAFARDITKNLYVGASLTGAFNVNRRGDDEAAAAALYGALGFVYRLGTLGPLREQTAAFTLSRLGKTFDSAFAASGAFPSPITPQIGYSAAVLETRAARAGFSLDLSFPSAQNVVLDVGVQFRVARAVLVSGGYKINFYEAVNTKTVNLPFIGISYTFTANTGMSDVLASRGWAQSEVTVGAAWNSLYDNTVQLVSGGAVINLGSSAAEAPQIIIED
ncbi:MAG: hypothetical protein LBC72_01180 [Spirochaetaceae bacterium]|nr:hypothetical protein [Spirochaetaceae bacterium]